MKEIQGHPKRKGTVHDFHAGTYLADVIGNTFKIKDSINFSEAIKPYNKKKDELTHEMKIKNVGRDVFDELIKNYDDETHKELMKANNTCQLPDTADLVVRKTVIEAFIEKHGETKPNNKGLSDGDKNKLESLKKFISELTVARRQAGF